MKSATLPNIQLVRPKPIIPAPMDPMFGAGGRIPCRVSSSYIRTVCQQKSMQKRHRMKTSLFVACIEIAVLGVLACCVLAALDQVFTPAQGAGGAKWPISAFAYLSILTVVGHATVLSPAKPDTDTDTDAESGRNEAADYMKSWHHALSQAFLSSMFGVLILCVAQVIAGTDGSLGVSVIQRQASSNSTAWPNQDTCLPAPDPNDTFVLYRASHMADWRGAMTGTNGWVVAKTTTLCNATVVEMSQRGGMNVSGMGLVVLGTSIGIALVFVMVGCIAVSATTDPRSPMPLFLEPTGVLCGNALIALPLVAGVTDVYAGCQDGVGLGFGFMVFLIWISGYDLLMETMELPETPTLVVGLITHLIPFLATLKPGVPGGIQLLSGILAIIGIVGISLLRTRRQSKNASLASAIQMAQASSFIPTSLNIHHNKPVQKDLSGAISRMFNTNLDARSKRL